MSWLSAGAGDMSWLEQQLPSLKSSPCRLLQGLQEFGGGGAFSRAYCCQEAGQAFWIPVKVNIFRGSASAMLCSFPWKILRKHAVFTKGLIY